MEVCSTNDVKMDYCTPMKVDSTADCKEEIKEEPLAT